MNKEEQIAIGLNNLGSHIGSGFGWLGFWLMLGMAFSGNDAQTIKAIDSYVVSESSEVE